MNYAAIKHLVSTEGKGGWSDGTYADDADFLKYFFSSADDEETDVGSDGDSLSGSHCAYSQYFANTLLATS